jgi:uncharacterized protein (DUF302 family)
MRMGGGQSRHEQSGTESGPAKGPIAVYTVITQKPFDEAVCAIEQQAAAHGFRVLHTHDVAATLREKGFPREPLKIVEICNARYASQVLEKDIRTALMLPCPISIYTRQRKTSISTMLPTLIADFFPGAEIEAAAKAVEDAVLQIVDQASGVSR